MLKYFVAIYERGPAWVKNRPLREQPLSAHVDYLTTLHGDGCVIMGGPFAYGGGGLVVFATDSSEAADLGGHGHLPDDLARGRVDRLQRA